MSGLVDDPLHWDKLAREIRAEAELQTDPFNRRSLRLIAQHYEAMVARARSRSLEEAEKSDVAQGRLPTKGRPTASSVTSSA